MAEDLSQLISGEQKLPSHFTVTDPYRVAEARNKSSVDLMEAIPAELQKLNVVKNAVATEQNKLINELDDSMNAYRHVQSQVFDQVEAQTQDYRDRVAQDEQVYGQLYQKRQQIAANAPESFFKNPLSYMATRIQLGFIDEKLNTIQNGIDVARAKEDQAYGTAARDLAILRSKELAADFAAAQIAYENSMLSLNHKINNISTNLAAAGEVNKLSEQRIYKSAQERAIGLALREEEEDAKFMYVRLTGSLDGFSPEKHTAAYATRWKELPAEEKVNLSRLRGNFTKSLNAGNPLDAKEMVSLSIANEDMPGLLSYVSRANVPGMQGVTHAVNQAYQRMFTDEVSRKVKTYETQNLKLLEATGGRAPEEVVKQIQQEVAGELNGVRSKEVLQNAVNGTMLRAAEYVQNSARGTFASVANSATAVIEVQRPLGIDFRKDLKYFKSPRWTMLVSAESPEFRQRASEQGEWAAFVNSIWDGLQAYGVDQRKIPTIISALTSGAIKANALNDPQQGQMYRQISTLGLDAIAQVPVKFAPKGLADTGLLTFIGLPPEVMSGYVTDPADIQNMRAKTVAALRRQPSQYSTSGIPFAPPGVPGEAGITGEYLRALKEKQPTK